MNLVQKMSHSLTRVVKNEKGLDDPTVEVLEYGFYMLIADTMKTILFAAAAFLSGVLPYALASLFFFGLLRVFAGGIHAKTWTGCLASSSVMHFAVIYGAVWMPLQPEHRLLLKAALYMLCLAAIISYAPSDHKNKPISGKKQRRKLRILSAVALHMVFAAAFTLPEPYGCIAAFSAFAECLLILPVTYRLTGNQYGDQYEYEVKTI